jgi:hypothetical protein
MISDGDGKEAATLDELEAAVQSTYRSVLEDALAAMKKPSPGAIRLRLMTSNELVLARLDAIERQLAYLIYKLS